MTLRSAILAACTLLFGAAKHLEAQSSILSPVPAPIRTRITITNGLLGAALGGLRAWTKHRPISRGMALGAIGGLTTSAARQIVATRRDAAGLSGRALHDVGLGVGSAAADSTFTIPIHLGPLVVRWEPGLRRWPTVRVNLTNLIVSSVAIAQVNGRIDWRSTLWSGAVTVLPRFPFSGVDVDNRARAGPGTIRLSRTSTFCDRESNGTRICRLDLAHESIHVLQLDMLHEWVGRDLESNLLRRTPVGRALGRWVELGGVGPGATLLFESTRKYQTRWTEYEAFWLTEGAGPPSP